MGADEGRQTNLRTVLEVAALVKAQYVDPVSLTELFRAYVATGSINGMLGTLNDPYTRYMDPEAYKQMQVDTTGIYGGIGIVVGIRDDRLTIVASIEQTRASTQGCGAVMSSNSLMASPPRTCPRMKRLA